MTRILTVFIADDEPLARRGLRGLLAAEGDCRIVGEGEDGRAALDGLLKYRPDVVFLDIKMPDLTGVQVLAALPRTYQPAVIFTTAYDDYALKAFELHAVDYLLKPFSEGRLHEALQRARKFQGPGVPDGSAAQKIARLVETLKDQGVAAMPAEARLVVKVDGEFRLVDLANIVWIGGEGDYVKFHTRKGNLLARESFKNLEAKLDPARFVRLHKSAMVSIDFVKSVRPTLSADDEVLMSDGTLLRASRNYRMRLRDALSISGRNVEVVGKK